MTLMRPFLTLRRIAVVGAIALALPAAAQAQVLRPDSAARADSASRAQADSLARARAADSVRIRALADSIVHAQMVADSLARAKAAADSALRVWSAAVTAARAHADSDSVARSKLPPDTTRPARSFADTASRFAVDGTQLQPGDWRYAVTVSVDSQTRSLGERDVSLARGMYGPLPAWVLVSSGGRGPLAASDSLYLGALNLQPLHWSARLGLAHVAAAFALDTIFGGTESPLGKQNIVMPRPGRLVINGEMLDAVLHLAPLAVGWRDSVMLLVTEPAAAVTTPAQLAVTGEETVTVPAGAFDCWVVDLQATNGQTRLWVSKSGQVVVRAVQAAPQLAPGATVQRELLAGAPVTSAGAPLGPPSPSAPDSVLRTRQPADTLPRAPMPLDSIFKLPAPPDTVSRAPTRPRA